MIGFCKKQKYGKESGKKSRAAVAVLKRVIRMSFIDKVRFESRLGASDEQQTGNSIGTVQT